MVSLSEIIIHLLLMQHLRRKCIAGRCDLRVKIYHVLCYLKNMRREKEIKAYISLEEHMACGVGACLGCVVKTKEVDHHSHVHNARICTDGPVFDAEEVEI